MDSLKQLFNKNTDHGRAIRTALQALVGLGSLIVGIFAIPGVYDLMGTLAPELQLAVVATWVGIISYLQNKLEQFLKHLDS